MSSSFAQEKNRLFNELDATLKRDLARLTTEANGGRSILFVYPPSDEDFYIEEAKEIYKEGFEFIDLRNLLAEFISSMGLESFKQCYEEMGKEIFVSQNYHDGTFYALLMKRIMEIEARELSPILIHTGVIYEMGFTNHNVMDEPVVKTFKHPLVFFYPATCRNEKFLFLDKQPASNYRCVVVH